MNLKTIAIASFVVGVIHFNIGPWQGMLWAKLAIELVAIVLLGVLLAA